MSCTCDIKINAVTKYDPTKTKTIRDRWVADVNRRFKKLKKEIHHKIVTEDYLEIKKASGPKLITNFQFITDAEKLDGFGDWLNGRTDDILLDADNNILMPDRWQDAYIDSAYKKGVQRAIQASTGEPVSELTAQALLAPIHASRVALLYSRAFNQLKGVTNEMSKQMSNVLSDGLIKGYGAEKMAKALNDRVDKIGITRARLIARTETINSHAEGTLTQFEQLGVNEVIAEVEWSTAGDDRVCQECASLEGSIKKVKDAHGIIPLHPNCRCAWLPVIAKSKPSTKQIPEEESDIDTTSKTKDPRKGSTKTISEEIIQEAKTISEEIKALESVRSQLIKQEGWRSVRAKEKLYEISDAKNKLAKLHRSKRSPVQITSSNDIEFSSAINKENRRLLSNTLKEVEEEMSHTLGFDIDFSKTKIRFSAQVGKGAGEYYDNVIIVGTGDASAIAHNIQRIKNGLVHELYHQISDLAPKSANFKIKIETFLKSRIKNKKLVKMNSWNKEFPDNVYGYKGAFPDDYSNRVYTTSSGKLERLGEEFYAQAGMRLGEESETSWLISSDFELYEFIIKLLNP